MEGVSFSGKEKKCESSPETFASLAGIVEMEYTFQLELLRFCNGKCNLSLRNQVIVASFKTTYQNRASC
jgi:hypothetical protein